MQGLSNLIISRSVKVYVTFAQNCLLFVTHVVKHGDVTYTAALTAYAAVGSSRFCLGRTRCQWMTPL